MKAKHFKQIKANTTHYKVWVTKGLFGNLHHNDFIIVLAKSHLNAIERAQRRGFGLGNDIGLLKPIGDWAHWKVKKLTDTNHWTNDKYY